MRAKEAMKILQISRMTLYKYVKNGYIKATKLHNGYYEYDEESVMKLSGKKNRTNVIYARVSTYKQKNDLTNQIELVKKYCDKNKLIYDKIISDISSGLDLNRTNFSKLLDEILHYKIDTIIISHKDRLTRLSFSILEYIFSKFGTKIIVLNKPDKYFDNEYFNDLLTLMHSFSTKFYSKRRVKNK